MESNSDENITLKHPPHHEQLELCKNRPAYRQGRNLTAVKVYTIANESQHLFIYGVPKIDLRTELKTQCQKFGQVINIHVVSDHETEIFTECFHVKYDRIQSARIAKRLLDNKSFYGGILHVCYAPEHESVQETKAKLLQRNKDVLSRLPNASEPSEDVSNTGIYKQTNINRKRKHPAIPLSKQRLAAVENPEAIWNGIPVEIDPRNSKRTKCDIESTVKVYGPQLSTSNSGESASTSNKSETSENMNLKSGTIGLVPSNVMKTNKINVVKRIVFKKK